MFDTIKTIYIAGPITTSSEPELNRAAFEHVESILEISYNVLNPWRNFGGGRTNSQTPPPPVYMRMSIHQLLNAHAIYMMRGWEKSKNCRAELAVAEALNLEIIYQS